MEPSDRSRYDPRVDVVRACAFLLVAVTHFSVTRFTDGITDRHLIVDTVALGLIHTGWLGVPLFLFVSGYSLALGKTERGYSLDVKQFFINRVLRLYPLWVVCVLSLMAWQHISGANVLSLLLLQTQDVPEPGPFGLAWSLQLEFVCYLLFPLLLSAVAANRKLVAVYFALFFAFRLNQWYLADNIVWSVSYNSVFGEGTVFLSGMILASLPKLTNQTVARISFSGGLAAFCAVAVFIWKSGGYQNPQGMLGTFFLIMPECLAVIFFVMLRGGLARIAAEHRRPPSLRAKRVRILLNLPFKALTHLGKVSYSAYIFSLYVYWFWFHAFGSITTGGWRHMIVAFATYLAILWGFATLTYHALELPFLNMRKTYVRKKSASNVPIVESDQPEFRIGVR